MSIGSVDFAAERMLCRHRSSYGTPWCSGVSLDGAEAPGCSRTWRPDDPPPLRELLSVAAHHVWRADAQGPPRQRQFSSTVARVQLALRCGVCAATQCSPSSRPLLRGIVVAAQPFVGRRRAAEATASVANE